MNKYRSFMAHQMDLFVNYRVASNKWSETYAANLQLFDRYCVSYYPDAEKLEQSMLEGWCGVEGNHIPHPRVIKIPNLWR